MIDNLELKLEGKLPVNLEDLFELVDSWGRTQDFNFGYIMILESQAKECYDLSNLLHTSKHSFGISFLDSKNSYNKQLLYFTKLALICKQIIFNFYFYLVSQIDDLSYLFCGSNFNGDLSNWDISNVKKLEWTFSSSQFNGDLSKWDVSNVNSLYCIFYENYSFNNNSLNSWNVSNVENMIGTFDHSIFNGDISKWNVSNVNVFNEMFYNSKFDGDISNWNFNEKAIYDSIFYINHNFETKYNNGKEIPTDETFLEWFQENKNKIASLNITKEELVNIDDYLISFNKDINEIK